MLGVAAVEWEVEALFKQLDEDGSGYLEMNELKAVVRKLQARRPHTPTPSFLTPSFPKPASPTSAPPTPSASLVGALAAPTRRDA
eukprot:3416127-Prymnesium_polylepis.1